MDATQWPKAALVYDFHKETGDQVNPSEGGGGHDIVRSNSPSAHSKHDKKKARLNKDQQALNCPRCNSTNTKFCYYNNYNPTQPRYLCKACRRYWTHGGTLRNVPVGGSSRKKNKLPPSLLAPSHQSNTSKLFLGLNTEPTTTMSSNFLAPAPPARSFMHDNNHDLTMGLYYADGHHHFLPVPPTFELSASPRDLSSYHVPMSSLQAMPEANNTRLLCLSSSGFQNIIKPTLNLCNDEGFGGTFLDTEGARRMFPRSFGELKQDSNSSVDTDSILDRGPSDDRLNNGVVYWNNHGLYN